MSQFWRSLATFLLLSLLPGCAASQSPTVAAVESPQWEFRVRDDGAVEWIGELLPSEPHTPVEWRAQAVWTSLEDAATTRLLADTGVLMTTYLPRHSTRLSQLGRAQGAGWLEFTLRQYPGGLHNRWVFHDPETETLGLEAMNAVAKRLQETLREEYRIARIYGVQRLEAERTLALMEIYWPRLQASEGPEAERLRGLWLQWMVRESAKEKDALYEARFSPEVWTRREDPPLQALRVGDGGIEAFVWNPDGGVWVPVMLRGVEGEMQEEDLPALKALGFNLIFPAEPSQAIEQRARELNIAVGSQLPEWPAVPIFQGWTDGRGQEMEILEPAALLRNITRDEIGAELNPAGQV